MKKLRSLCGVIGALTALTFVTPAISQEYRTSDRNNIAKYETVSSTEAVKELTQEEAMKSLYGVFIHTFKTGDDLEQSLEKTGVNYKGIVKALTGKDDEAKAVVAEFKRDCIDFSVAAHIKQMPFTRQEDRDHLAAGMNSASL